MPQTPWYLYVVRCGDDSLYAGVTCDLPRRLAQHQQGRGARYTRGRGPLSLAAAWRFPDQAAALRAEAAFNHLRRAAKEGWIARSEPLADGGLAGVPPFEGVLEPIPSQTLVVQGDR